MKIGNSLKWIWSSYLLETECFCDSQHSYAEISIPNLVVSGGRLFRRKEGYTMNVKLHNGISALRSPPANGKSIFIEKNGCCMILEFQTTTMRYEGLMFSLGLSEAEVISVWSQEQSWELSPLLQALTLPPDTQSLNSVRRHSVCFCSTITCWCVWGTSIHLKSEVLGYCTEKTVGKCTFSFSNIL